jgi:hypothetical protein
MNLFQRAVMQYLLSRLLEKQVERMKSEKTGLKRWAPAILLMIVIFIASSTPGNDIPAFGSWDTILKKGAHMTGYALLAVGYLHALGNPRKANRLIFLLAIIMAALYAATDEFHQSFTPGRHSSVADVGIDALGAVLGTTIGLWIFKRRRTRIHAEKRG